MLSRIVTIDGQPGTFTGSPSLTSAYDVPVDAWYNSGTPYKGLPPSTVLMETGLQPCGVLSAYLRTSLLEPEADLYFRNLDGHGRVLADLDLRGSTVLNEVVLKSSVRGPGAILQSFTFALSCRGQRFYEGEATFGYFRFEGLSRQAGLGAGPVAAGEPERSPVSRPVRVPARPGSAARRLSFLSELFATRDGGAYGKGSVRGSGAVTPSDWYFAAHFHQDPVMPGSLGVEAAVQALVAYGRWRWPRLAAGVVHHVTGNTVTWRYRGQITPEDRTLSVEVHVSEISETPAGVTLTGDASIWRGPLDGGVRIYAVSGLAIRLDYA